MTEAPDAQGKAQAKRREIRSPRNGAVVPTLRPGHTANPAGSSAKQRLRSAINKLIDEGKAEQVIEAALRDAVSRKSRANGLKALELIAKAAGLFRDEEQRVIVETSLVFEERKDGSAVKPMRMSVKQTEVRAAVERPNDEMEIHT